jgi:hypothetical protein
VYFGGGAVQTSLLSPHGKRKTAVRVSTCISFYYGDLEPRIISSNQVVACGVSNWHVPTFTSKRRRARSFKICVFIKLKAELKGK